MAHRVIALFQLAPGRTIEDYRRWSLAHVRPVMRRMQSVTRFDDFQVVGGMDGDPPPHELCEVIEVTDFEQFERDNERGEGAVLADEWRSWLSEWSVIYVRDLEVATPER